MSRVSFVALPIFVGFANFVSRSFFLACKTGSCFLFNQVFGLQSLFVSFRCFSFQLRPLVVAVGVTRVAPALHVLAWERAACCTAGASPAGGLPPLRDLKLQLWLWPRRRDSRRFQWTCHVFRLPNNGKSHQLTRLSCCLRRPGFGACHLRRPAFTTFGKCCRGVHLTRRGPYIWLLCLW